jgi:hypothetical protein
MPTAINSPPRGFLLSSKPIVLWTHDPTTSYAHDAVVNPEMFSNFRDGQLLRIHCPRVNTTQQQQSQQQSQNNSNKSDQQDGKKQHDHNTPQQQHQQSQQQSQQNQQQQLDQSSLQPQQCQSSDKQEHGEQLDSVIVKGHAVDKESLAKQPQLQVN